MSIAFYINLKNLVHNESDYYFYSNNIDKIPITPYISRRFVIDFYDSMYTKLFDKGILNTKVLKRYIKDITPLLEAFIESITNEEKTSKDFAKILYKHIETEKQRVLTIIEQVLNSPHPLKWIADNPGTQLTSSINPIFEDVAEWYGKHYIKK